MAALGEGTCFSGRDSHFPRPAGSPGKPQRPPEAEEAVGNVARGFVVVSAGGKAGSGLACSNHSKRLWCPGWLGPRMDYERLVGW